MIVETPDETETNKVWYLKQNRLFEDSADDVAERNAAIFTMQTFARRAMIFDQYDAARTIYMIKTGKVRIARLTEDGKEVTIAVLGAGDLFGEEAIFQDKPRTTFAIAPRRRTPVHVVGRRSDVIARVRTEDRTERRESDERSRARTHRDGRGSFIRPP